MTDANGEAGTSGRGDASSPLSAFGEYLRTQRQAARLSLRQLAELARVSNPYLSQIERGLHQPSIQVVTSLADALNLSADALLRQAAGLAGEEVPSATEAAIRADNRLTDEQQEALLAVYRSLVERGGADDAAGEAAPARTTRARKAPARRAATTATPARKATTRKTTTSAAPARKTTARKATTRKATARKAAPGAAPARKSTTRKATAGAAPARTSTGRKTTARTATAATSKTPATRAPAKRATKATGRGAGAAATTNAATKNAATKNAATRKTTARATPTKRATKRTT